MEKRVFIAIVLSFAVLYIWSLSNPPKKNVILANESQVVDNKQFTEIKTDINETKGVEAATLDVSKISEEVYSLENDKIKVDFTNVGGSPQKLYLKEFNSFVPVKNIFGVKGYDGVEYKLVSSLDNKIVYSFENSEVKILKTFEIDQNDYLLNVSLNISAKNNLSILNELNIVGFNLDMSNQDKNSLEKSLNEYFVNNNSQVYRRNNAFKFDGKNNYVADGQVEWLGYRDRYFVFILKPEFKTKQYLVKQLNEGSLEISTTLDKVDFPTGSGLNLNAKMFVGPERLDLLKSYGYGFEKVKKFYKFALFDVISMIIYEIMHFMNRFIHNWGVCIILISVLVYFSMYPLTFKAMLSMKKMQSVQPKIAALREKYKSNPQKINEEMIKIYKEYKINPLGGCLPFLLQMPVFIGLYQVLWRDVSFKGANFIWIKDLSMPDRLFIFPFSIPFLGNEFNLLPVLMMVVMFVQQKITAKSMVAVSEEQIMQQKMMVIIMPLMMGFLFYKFASGLTLYFTMFYLFSAITQWKMSSSKTEIV